MCSITKASLWISLVIHKAEIISQRETDIIQSYSMHWCFDNILNAQIWPLKLCIARWKWHLSHSVPLVYLQSCCPHCSLQLHTALWMCTFKWIKIFDSYSKRFPRAWPNNGKYNKVTGEIAAPGHKRPYINSFNVVLHFKSNNMRQASTSAHSFYLGVNQTVNVYNKYLYVQKLNVVHLIEWICKLYFKERLSLMGQGHYVLSREKAYLFTYHSN